MATSKSRLNEADTGTRPVLHGCEPRTVTIIYRALPQYRVDFFESLRNRLAAERITLKLVYGKNRVCPKQDRDGHCLGNSCSQHFISDWRAQALLAISAYVDL